MHLVKLYRAPGLHNRAQEVLARLLQIEPDSQPLHVEYARSMVDCGQSQEAVKHLGKRGKAMIAKENYPAARAIYEEILHFEPGNEEATVSIEMIDKENFAKRRERKRRAIRMVLTVAGMLLLGTMIGIELTGRSAYIETRSLISRERMIEQGQYHEAIGLLEAVRREHPFAFTTFLDIPRMIADLEERAHEAGVKLPGQSGASPGGSTLRKRQ
jgi:tetratricopeptide (TPR) repeat protein